ncbi:hypothetical protein PVAP13_1NG099544 [Panicum virgatum]|uniref:Uncharacterized protein n=1 Tax=Panicum virgatum TaxID=38727 RepID=A0A8T0WPQ6_PANVG|nr:hypothetical protein PVAP13_1NG099544 [Panicum virgatum]
MARSNSRRPSGSSAPSGSCSPGPTSAQAGLGHPHLRRAAARCRGARPTRRPRCGHHTPPRGPAPAPLHGLHARRRWGGPTQPFPPAAAAWLLHQYPILRHHSLVLRRLHPPLRPGHAADFGPLPDPLAAVYAPVPRDSLAVYHEPTTARSSFTTPMTSRSSPWSVPSRTTRPPRGSSCRMVALAMVDPLRGRHKRGLFMRWSAANWCSSSWLQSR